MKIAKKHKLIVIEDACESLLATYRGQKVGTFGQSAVFAFYANKQMTTGEGGMVATNDKRVDSLCRSLRNQGRTPDMRWLDHDRLGYNYRLDEMSAALGLAQIEKIRFLIRKRRELAGWYERALAPYAADIATPKTARGSTNTWFVYVVTLKNPRVDRDDVIKKLAKRGVHTKPYLPSIHLFKFYRTLGYRRGEFPVSEKVSGRTIALPFYIGLAEKDVASIAKTLHSVLSSYEQ